MAPLLTSAWAVVEVLGVDLRASGRHHILLLGRLPAWPTQERQCGIHIATLRALSEIVVGLRGGQLFSHGTDNELVQGRAIFTCDLLRTSLQGQR